MGRDTTLQPAAVGNRAAVVDPSATVEVCIIRSPRAIDTVRKSVAAVSSGSTLTDHLRDDIRWTGVLHLASEVRVTGASTIMTLHHTRVADTETARRRADASPGFLDDHGEDDPVVNACLVGDFLDRIPDGNLLRSGR